MTSDRPTRILTALATARALLRAEGNPHHDAEGKFTSVGGEGHGHGHGKHWARRQRRRRKLRAIRKRYRREAAELKGSHKADRRELTRDQRAGWRDQQRGHKAERKEHIRWEASERKSLAKEHGHAHKDVDREHAAAVKRHEKGAAKEHQEIDRQHAAKEARIAKGERKARNTERRHERERATEEEQLGRLHDNLKKWHANELAAADRRGASAHEKQKIRERHAEEHEKAKDAPERRREAMAERHAAERKKVGELLARSPKLRERLDRQTAAKHEHVEKRPERLEAKRQRMHGRLDRQQARERREQGREHRRARADLKEGQRDAMASLKEDHRTDRESTREQHREERRELVERLREELAEHGFKRKGGKGVSGQSHADRSLGGDLPGDVCGLSDRPFPRSIPVGEGVLGSESRRISPARIHKASSAESIIRYVLRRRGWTAAFRRGDLTDAERLQLLGDVREYAREWLRHEAEMLFRVHGVTNEQQGTATRTEGAEATGESGGATVAGSRHADGHQQRTAGLAPEDQPALDMDLPGIRDRSEIREGRGTLERVAGHHVPRAAEGQAETGGEIDGGLATDRTDRHRVPSRSHGAPGQRGQADPKPGHADRVPGGMFVDATDDPSPGLAVSRALSDALAHHVRRFFARAKQFVREAIVAGAMILGGPEPLDAHDLAEAERQAQVQAEYFDRFERDAHLRTPEEIASEGIGIGEPLSAAQFAARAEQYGANAPWGGNINWDRRRRILSGKFNQERRIHRIPMDRHHACPTCKRESDKGWVQIGSLEPIGSAGCECLGINCDCHFEFRNVA